MGTWIFEDGGRVENNEKGDRKEKKRGGGPETVEGKTVPGAPGFLKHNDPRNRKAPPTKGSKDKKKKNAQPWTSKGGNR